MKTIISVAVIAVFLISCDCGESQRLTDSTIGFRFTSNNDNNNLFKVFITDSSFVADSVRLNNPPYISTTLQKVQMNASDYSFVIRNFYNPSIEGVDIEINKIFYIYLNETDIDTLTLWFIPKKGKCEDRFDDLRINYNGEVISSINYPLGTSIGLILPKK